MSANIMWRGSVRAPLTENQIPEQVSQLGISVVAAVAKVMLKVRGTASLRWSAKAGARIRTKKERYRGAGRFQWMDPVAMAIAAATQRKERVERTWSEF